MPLLYTSERKPVVANTTTIVGATTTGFEEISGKFQGSRVRRDTWMVGTIAGGRTIVGHADAAELIRGREYKFFGQWKETIFGRQFSFDHFEEADLETKNLEPEVLSRHLSGSGLALSEIRKIIANFGDESFQKLCDCPDEIADRVPGILAETLQSVSRHLQANREIKAVELELYKVMAGHGIPRKAIKEAIEKWGKRAAVRVRQNPYELMRLSGCGFRRADAVYLSLGRDPNRLKRQALCAWYLLDEDQAGHTWFSRKDLIDRLQKELPAANTGEAILLAVRAGRLVERREEDQVYYSPASRAATEKEIAERLTELVAAKPRWGNIESIQGISDHQRGQLVNATALSVGILAGSPGTGKTFTLAALIRSKSSVGPVFVCAPTGKAAVRASESLRANGLPNKAITIHKLLDYRPGKDLLSGGFVFNERNKLDCGWLIADESSMIDAKLFLSLLKACPVGMQILLVGDTGQLSPVGYGAPLRDLIEAGVPTGMLTEIRRNAGRIVEACAEIKQGKQVKIPMELDLPAGNLVSVEAKKEPAQLQAVKDQINEAIRREYHPLEQVQVIVAINAKSEVSRAKLNPVLQAMLNPNGFQPDEKSAFRVGDKIIATKNNFHRVVEEVVAEEVLVRINGKEEQEAYVANGEIGYIQELQKGRATVRFSSPERIVLMDTLGENCVIELGYAISIHKSQGSEWPVVITVVDGSAGGNMIGCRELWYTAISRAKSYCVIVGEQHRLNHQCRRVSTKDRITRLAETLEKNMAEAIAGGGEI